MGTLHIGLPPRSQSMNSHGLRGGRPMCLFLIENKTSNNLHTVVGRWLVGWSLVVHCGQTAKRCIIGKAYSYYGTLIGNPTPGIQWYNFRPPGVTPNRGIGPREALFVKLL